MSHIPSYTNATIDSFTVICVCGWQDACRYPAYVNTSDAKRDAALSIARHARHMELVHIKETHSKENCGRLCICPRPKVEAADV